MNGRIEGDNLNEKIVLDFFEAFCRSDLEAIRGLLHPDAVWKQMMASSLPGVGVHHGHKGIVDGLLTMIVGLFDKPEIPRQVINSLISKGDVVIAETESHETAKGRKYNNLYCWAFEIRDGRIAVIREYFDSHYVVEFMGVS